MGNCSPIGIIFSAPFTDNSKTFFLHKMTDHFLRDSDILLFQKTIHAPIPVPLLVFIEKKAYWSVFFIKDP